MPTWGELFGYRIYFWSREDNEAIEEINQKMLHGCVVTYTNNDNLTKKCLNPMIFREDLGTFLYNITIKINKIRSILTLRSCVLFVWGADKG